MPCQQIQLPVSGPPAHQHVLDPVDAPCTPSSGGPYTCGNTAAELNNTQSNNQNQADDHKISTADKVKLALDVVGFVPVVGDFANAGSALISLAQGKYGEAALSALAAIPVVGAVGEVGKAAKLAGEAEKGAKLVEDAVKGGEVLSRFGTSTESVARLARKAEESEKVIGIHGVSTTARETAGEVSRAARSEVEKSFTVHNTPTKADPLHRTVELPKPVTKTIADAFNKVFGRM